LEGLREGWKYDVRSVGEKAGGIAGLNKNRPSGSYFQISRRVRGCFLI